MTITSAIVIIVACVVVLVVVEFTAVVCGVLTVRRHKHDGLQDPRVLRSVKVTRRRRLNAEEMQDVGDGY